jgi:outer membrane protein TolC
MLFSFAMNYPVNQKKFPSALFLLIRQRWIVLVSFLLLAIPSQLIAQKQTLWEVLDQSKQQYPLLKAKQAEISSAQRKVTSARTDYLPSLIVQDQYTYSTNNNVTGSFFPNEGTALSPSGGIRPENIYQGTYGSFTTAIVDWRVFNFGKLAANVRTARAELSRSQVDYENELFQHQVRVVDAFLLLLINQQLVESQQHNLERALTFKRVVNASVSNGLRAGVDSSLANAEYAKAQLLLLESQRAEKTQQLRLAELSGTGQDNLQVDSMLFYSQLPAPIHPATEAYLQNPTLQLAQAQINASQARSIAIHRSFLPSISLLAAGWARGSGVSNTDGTYQSDMAHGFRYQVYNYMFGISTRWNLTNIIKVQQDYRSEQFQLERFRQLFQAQKLQLNRQMQEATIGFELSLEQARLAPVQLAAARSAFNQAQSRYESGLTDLFTLAQSVATLNRAEVDRSVANGNVWRALLLQAAAAGDLSLFLNQVK